MIKIENVEVTGWRASIRGMRSPMNSWDLSDTEFSDFDLDLYFPIQYDVPIIGENDMKLMRKLAQAGSDHGKFLRMITVTVDITAPLYWWKEFDTYKVGTVANSCSTMHKIHAKEFELDDFSHEHLLDAFKADMNRIITSLNSARLMYLETKDKDFWWQMIQLLPSSYNQKRTVQLNYQVLHAMDNREFHKLDEWREFIKWRNQLPYFKDIFQIDNNQYKTDYTVIPTKEYEILLEKTKSV